MQPVGPPHRVDCVLSSLASGSSTPPWKLTFACLGKRYLELLAHGLVTTTPGDRPHGEEGIRPGKRRHLLAGDKGRMERGQSTEGSRAPVPGDLGAHICSRLFRHRHHGPPGGHGQLALEDRHVFLSEQFAECSPGTKRS